MSSYLSNTAIQGNAVNASTGSGFVIAKQISDFPIQKIQFSPFETGTLVSCGRENIRFWRMRKGHLPGRPVCLNQYSRGYHYGDFVFHSCPAYYEAVDSYGNLYAVENLGKHNTVDTYKESHGTNQYGGDVMLAERHVKGTYLAGRASEAGVAASAHAKKQSKENRRAVFVISDKGLLFRIDYDLEKVRRATFTRATIT